jgi:hypothetical protein
MILKLQILKIIFVLLFHILTNAYLYVLPLASEGSFDISSKGFSSRHTKNDGLVLEEYRKVRSLRGLRSFCILLYFILVL